MAKKKGCLGLPTPVTILLVVVLLAVVVMGLLAGPIGKAFGMSGLPAWMALAAPHPSISAETVFTVGGFEVTNTILATWVTMLVLTILFVIYRSKLSLVPGRFQTAIEAILEYVYGICASISPKEVARKFFPLVCTIFLFVGFNSWLSLIPGYGSLTFVNSAGHTVELIRGAGTDLNTTLSLAVVAFIVAEVVAFKEQGLKYILKYINFSGLITAFKTLFKGKIGGFFIDLITGIVLFLTGIIEFISEISRLISLTFRLFGNMTAGEILLASISFLIPYLVPTIFYGLEVLVGFIQALVFSSLTMVYISLSYSSHEAE
ncbi:MAG: F0F1 ATP synthase subunit A [Dehalococcoidales bacterium]|nr:F0F1 ATP synthase subunit A [Dehalococcoidales bacterium]